MKIATHTLGCKVNQFETAAMEEELRRRGHQLIPFEDVADIYIINTCSVTAVSDKKSRQMIRRARKQSPDGIIGVCGCYPQTHQDEIQSLGIDVVGGTGDRIGFLNMLEDSHHQRQPMNNLDNAMKRRVFEPLEAHGLEGRTRATLKVEDGCVNFCSYCIIPYARGPVRSAPLETVVAQATQLAKDGYQEIVVAGIEISSWGQDLKHGLTLIDLLEAICQALPSQVRLRLGSLEPRTITEDFCQRAVKLTNLCPHFHLSMQSGCDVTLKAMNRKYDSARYYQSVSLLNQYFNLPAVTTDMIVGFPQETDDHFSQTLEFIQKCQFSSMHIFPYSIRPNTPAADMDGQIEKSVKDARAKLGATVAEEMEQTYLNKLIGTTLDVLFEEEKDGQWQGHAPNYVAVRVDGANLHNQIRPVTITGVAPWGLVGSINV